MSYTKLALSEHCLYKHQNNMKLSVFKLGFVKCFSAIDLDREGNRIVTKFRTDIFGLNRLIIIK